MKLSLYQFLNALIHLFLMASAAINFMMYFPIPAAEKGNYIAGSIWFWIVAVLSYIGYISNQNRLLRADNQRYEAIIKSLEHQTSQEQILTSIRSTDSHFVRVEKIKSVRQ